MFWGRSAESVPPDALWTWGGTESCFWGSGQPPFLMNSSIKLPSRSCHGTKIVFILQGHQKSSLTASVPQGAGSMAPGPPLTLTHIQRLEVSTETQQKPARSCPGGSQLTVPCPALAPFVAQPSPTSPRQEICFKKQVKMLIEVF